MNCKEYISYNNLPKELLELFDVSDVDKFKENVEKVLKAFPQISEPIRNPVATTGKHTKGYGCYSSDSEIRKAFNLK